MTKKIVLSLAVGLMLALSITAGSVGCGGNGNNGGSGGGGGGGAAGGGGGGGGGGDVDMGFACVANPMSGDDFLNSCAPATVDKVELAPFYPTLAPAGVLPTLQ